MNCGVLYRVVIGVAEFHHQRLDVDEGGGKFCNLTESRLGEYCADNVRLGAAL
jgi:hypothetical protein